MDSSLPAEIGSTIQSASLNRAPSPTHDLNPSTSASQKQPVKISPSSSFTYEDIEGIDEEDEEDIPYDVLKPVPRRQSFGPLPDLRFEQSYLRSLEGAGSRWAVAGITVRDQVLLPLVQGMLWSLVLHGWRYWNRNAVLHGETIGARARRWWYKTNNWHLPQGVKGFGKNQEKSARGVGDVSLARYAKELDFY